VRFADSGPGIPDDVREKIFTPFFTTKARGTGLGLPTAKRLVEAHHGTIDIACPPGGGTHVTVRLPLHQPEGPVTGGPLLEIAHRGSGPRWAAET
jgi:signal transduction histidine kinase